MIAKSLRLKANQVKYVLLKGKKAGNNYLTIKFMPCSRYAGTQTNQNSSASAKRPMDNSCFAVVVSAKIDPSAVVRNRLRRQIYEIIRLNQNIFYKPFRIVIIVRPDIHKLDYQGINKELIHCLKKSIFHEQK